MATFLSDGPANEEEAVVLAAILRYLEREEADLERTSHDDVSRWALAGRVEAQGRAVTRETLRPGWGAGCFTES